MKKRITGIAALFILCVFPLHLFAAGPGEANDIGAFPFCNDCGMDREMFSNSRMLIEYEDGSAAGMCSIHCAAVNMIRKPTGRIMVGDYHTKNLIDAETATWVIGGNQAGVMTINAKWAFESEPDARAFVQAHGGTIATFDDALKATFEEMYEDVKMIRNKRRH